MTICPLPAYLQPLRLVGLNHSAVECRSSKNHDKEKLGLKDAHLEVGDIEYIVVGYSFAHE
jgi:hypothetical protein